MDASMFKSFLEFLEETGRPALMLTATKVAFYMALRISELIRLKRGQVRIDKEGDVYLDLPNKVYKAGSSRPPRASDPEGHGYRTIELL